MAFQSVHFCGCWRSREWDRREFLPLLDVDVATTILARTSRTVLTQTMANPSKSDAIDEVHYTFPLYDGVSVVAFKCVVGERTIVGVVKEKQQARAEYKDAVERGETAGLLEQMPESSDVFTTRIGNVPPNEKVVVEIVYIGELKHDAEAGGSRFTVPMVIAPRYGALSTDSSHLLEKQVDDRNGIKIVVDVTLEEGSGVRGLQSPSHPIAVTIGQTSSMSDEAFDHRYASATLSLGSVQLDKDFVIIVTANGQDTPKALLETHDSIPDQRAIMATLVPKFNLPNAHPEIVFVVDRSGSMRGQIDTLVSAMKTFLKSLPVGVKFNICSFGTHFDFLFERSRTYDESSLTEAVNHLNSFAANYGGTNMLEPLKAVVEKGFKDMPLEVMVLTDGEIWNEQELFSFINEAVTTRPVRFFSLGIGSGASSSLVEGIARAGGGFAQFVSENEMMDKKVVRMLKGALMPQINDYTLEVQYEKDEMNDEEEFEMVESASASLEVTVSPPKVPPPEKKTISLFSPIVKEEPTNPPAGRYDHLPEITVPTVLQAPHKVPGLYPFNRTTVYIMLSEKACQRQPKLVVLRGTSEHGPLELKIPVQDVGRGQTIHQLAAKKAVHELEQGRGWMIESKDEKGQSLRALCEGRWSDMVEREAVRLGVRFQVGGKWCSFVAVEENADGSTNKGRQTWVSDCYAATNHDTGAQVTTRVMGAGGRAGRRLMAKRSVHTVTGNHLQQGLQLLALQPSRQRETTPSSTDLLGEPLAPGLVQPFVRQRGPTHVSTSLSGGFRPSSASNSVQPFIPPPGTTHSSTSVFGSGFVDSKLSSSAPAFGSSNAVQPLIPPLGTTHSSTSLFGSGFVDSKLSTSTPSFGEWYSAQPSFGEWNALGPDNRSSSPPSVKTDEERMRELVAQQNFDGSWNWTASLSELLAVGEQLLQEAFSADFRQKLESTPKQQALMATIAAIVFFEVRLVQYREVWEIMVDKARGWVQTQLGPIWLEETDGVAKLFPTK